MGYDAKMLRMKLSDKLRAACEQRRWDRYDLVDLLDNQVSRSTVDNWFHDRTRPSLPVALQLSRILGVPLEYLADDELTEPPPAPMTHEERAIVMLCRVKGLDLETAMRRLEMTPANQPNGISVGGRIGRPEEPLPGKRKKGG